MGGFSEVAAGLRPYPNGEPGYKEPTTSRDAAKAVASKMTVLREKVYAAICASGDCGLTSDECALVLGESILAVRPRCSELRKTGQIKPNGARRLNASKLMAKVLVKA